MASILWVAKSTDIYTPIVFCSDSRYMVDSLTKNFIEWEEKGYIGIPNKKMVQATVGILRERSSETWF